MELLHKGLNAFAQKVRGYLESCLGLARRDRDEALPVILGGVSTCSISELPSSPIPDFPVPG